MEYIYIYIDINVTYFNHYLSIYLPIYLSINHIRYNLYRRWATKMVAEYLLCLKYVIYIYIYINHSPWLPTFRFFQRPPRRASRWPPRPRRWGAAPWDPSRSVGRLPGETVKSTLGFSRNIPLMGLNGNRWDLMGNKWDLTGNSWDLWEINGNMMDMWYMYI